jgi:hypothetical protein
MSKFTKGDIVRHKVDTQQQLVYLFNTLGHVGNIAQNVARCQLPNGLTVDFDPASLVLVDTDAPDVLQRLAALEAKVAEMEQGLRFA